jgi:hypothetical protein
MQFNGSSQNLDIVYSSDFDLSVGSHALMTWLNTTSVQDDMIGAFNSGSPFAGFAFSVWTSGYLSEYNDSFGFQSFSSIPCNDGNDHHIAIVNTGSALKGYIDGVLTQTIVVSGLPSAGSGQTIRIARDSNASPSRWYNGKLWDMRIYKNTALTDEQIKTIYESRGSDNITTGNVMRLLMNGESGTTETGTVLDLSKSGNNGSSVGSPTYNADLIKTTKRRR